MLFEIEPKVLILTESKLKQNKINFAHPYWSTVNQPWIHRKT